MNLDLQKSFGALLANHGQSQVLRFVDELNEEQLCQLAKQLAEIDFDLLKELVRNQDQKLDWAEMARRANPPQAFRLHHKERISPEQAKLNGQDLLSKGKIGVILVAGGQGTRLSFDLPKGLYPIGPLSNRSLLQMHCDRVLAIANRYKVCVPLYVMTSPATDEATRRHLEENENFGLGDDLQVFCQGSMPAIDVISGQLLLASKGELALSPDGHGGLLSALQSNGCLQAAEQRGVEHFYYLQVDNPLAPICEPELLGYHYLSQSELTTQVVTKRFAKEKVGNVVEIDGKVQIIEYSDFPDDVASQTNPDGSLRFWAGNIAIHVFQLQFLKRVVGTVSGLPFHRAHKPVNFINSAGEIEKPLQPNAIKFERFIFDLLPLAERSIAVEGLAADVFAPVKNANGAAADSPELTQAALLFQHRNWLQAAGANLPSGVRVEIHPAWALDSHEVKQKLQELTHSGHSLSFECDTYLQ
ncbi:MAG: UTP--glucose-1-phosphate uridylyltransferase [Planctomycetales bacterium]|nr:UTP--glucose-1-phosphate uridylyltransferase [Planctomycetales bacterium]